MSRQSTPWRRASSSISRRRSSETRVWKTTEFCPAASCNAARTCWGVRTCVRRTKRTGASANWASADRAMRSAVPPVASETTKTVKAGLTDSTRGTPERCDGRE